MSTPDSFDAIRAKLGSASRAQEFAFFANAASRPVIGLKFMLERIYGATAIRYLRVCARPALQQEKPRFPKTGAEGADLSQRRHPRRELWRIFEIRAIIGPLDIETADDYLDVENTKRNPSPRRATVIIALFEMFYHGATFGWEIAGARLWVGEDDSGDPVIRHFSFHNVIRDGGYTMLITTVSVARLKDMGMNPKRIVRNRTP